jgi:hypothetical protein
MHYFLVHMEMGMLSCLHPFMGMRMVAVVVGMPVLVRYTFMPVGMGVLFP